MWPLGSWNVSEAQDASAVVMRRPMRLIEARTSRLMAKRVVFGRRKEAVRCGWRRIQASPTISPTGPVSAMAVVMPATGAD